MIELTDTLLGPLHSTRFSSVHTSELTLLAQTRCNLAAQFVQYECQHKGKNMNFHLAISNDTVTYSTFASVTGAKIREHLYLLALLLYLRAKTGKFNRTQWIHYSINYLKYHERHCTLNHCLQYQHSIAKYQSKPYVHHF